MAVFTAEAIGSDMTRLFGGVATNGILGIQDRVGTSPTATEIEVTFATDLQVLQSVRYLGTDLAWNGLVPASGSYIEMQSWIGNVKTGTLTGFTAEQLNLITIGQAQSVNAFRVLNGNDTLNGSTGDDVLFGGYGGSDIFNGGGGNNTFIAAYHTTFAPTYQFNGGAGTDTVSLYRDARAPDPVADLAGSSFASIDRLLAAPEVHVFLNASQFDGGQIAMTAAIGGTGQAGPAGAQFTFNIDTTDFDASGFTNAGGQIDRITYLGDGAANAITGSIFKDAIFGDGGGDILGGGDGNDIIDGETGEDTIAGQAGDDRINGGDGNDTIFGDDTIGAQGNDTLSGDAGDDAIDGGGGTDTANYASTAAAVVVSLAIAGPQLVSASEGNDTLIAIENLTGSAFNDRLTGDTGVNRLTGGNGNDLLDGGGATDTLVGGFGNDTFVMGNGSDVIVELASQGIDTVTTTITRSLAIAGWGAIDNLTLLTGAVNGTGNTLNNVITGNAAANILTGALGNDTLIGGLGNDTLIGGAGLDRMTGGTGNDTFVFNTAVFNTALNAATNKDTITDFNHLADTMKLENTGVGLFNALSVGVLKAGAFHANTTGLATEADDRIIYNKNTGALFYDADGSGKIKAIQFATVTAHLVLDQTDFLVI